MHTGTAHNTEGSKTLAETLAAVKK